MSISALELASLPSTARIRARGLEGIFDDLAGSLVNLGSDATASGASAANAAGLSPAAPPQGGPILSASQLELERTYEARLAASRQSPVSGIVGAAAQTVAGGVSSGASSAGAGPLAIIPAILGALAAGAQAAPGVAAIFGQTPGQKAAAKQTLADQTALYEMQARLAEVQGRAAAAVASANASNFGRNVAIAAGATVVVGLGVSLAVSFWRSSRSRRRNGRRR